MNPLESTSFKAADESYQSGYDTGTRLAEGATEARDIAVLEGIVAMARALGMRTVAEGVETGDQADVVSKTAAPRRNPTSTVRSP